jgi:hypothetical protein
MMIRLKPLSLTLLAALLTAWISYRQSYRSPATTHVPQVKAPSSVSGRSSREMAVLTDKMEQLHVLLERPFNSRTSTETWDIISGLSVAQIRQALDLIPKDKATDAAENMARALYFRWAQMDPSEALAAAALEGKKEGADRSPNKKQALSSAYAAWFKRDPDAAILYAQTSTLVSRWSYADLMGKYLATLPPAEAAEKMRGFGKDEAEIAGVASKVRAWGMVSSPEDRKAFLDGIASSGMTAADAQPVLKSFTMSWGLVDPAAALVGLDGIPLDDEEKAQTHKEIMLGWAGRNPVEALAWAAKENPPETMANLVSIYSNCSFPDVDSALASLDTLSRNSPDFREEFMKLQLGCYYQDSWLPFGRNGTAERLFFSDLKIHYDHWAASAPAAAEKWVGSLEPALQQKLHTSADEKH